MRVLVLGSSGQVAMALAALRAHGFEVVCAGRPSLDLTMPASIDAAIATHRPDVVVNAAAYTAVDRAESEPDAAHALNATGAGDSAAAARKVGAAFIHLSTDYVFDGTKPAPYREDDAPHPLSVYGQSKLAGELAVTAAHQDAIVLRTSWVYAAHGANFVRTMLRLAGEGRTVRVVDDQIGAPTSAGAIADAILSLFRQMKGRTLPGRGVFHLTCGGETSWCGFARTIFAASAARGGPTADVTPISTAEYPTAARRPANSRLDCTKLSQTFGITLPDWREALEPVMDVLVRPLRPLR
ncbi:MAG TPA: dTDP-4-dehydrorhamnose reductase [Micropepsaceae bacterium]|nr:dTDP-4-dehydrorhamnose reductase [Micropepsaceae bacterium]